MSMFLGPIHYWLYNKIGNQEELTRVIANAAVEHGWLDVEAASNFTKELPPLESVIDEGNIHGWLQEQIKDAEERYAQLIVMLSAHLDEIQKQADKFGEDHAPNVIENAEDVYKYFENFFVNGMPCDHVNVVTERNEKSIEWEMTTDIHVQYWKEGNVSDYYTLRKAVMDGMLADSNYKVNTVDTSHYKIIEKL